MVFLFALYAVRLTLTMSRKGRHAALSYLCITLLGAVFVGLLFYAANGICSFGFMNNIMTTVDIALLNSMYRFLGIAFVFPITRKVRE